MTLLAKGVARSWLGISVLWLWTGLLYAADTTPPTWNYFTATQAVITDFPTKVKFNFVHNRAYYDPVTGTIWPDSLFLWWPLRSNASYTIWYGPTILGPWTEFGTSSNVHPARLNGTAITYVSAFHGNNPNRFYQIRMNTNYGVTFP